LGTAANTVAVVVLANDLARAMKPLFHERELTIEVIGSVDHAVRCDRDDFAEILGNLMENACKWAESRIEVRVERQAREVTVTICDDGPGLDPIHLEKVRERGVRLDETVPGSGLGLAIASELTALYEGSLDLVSPGPMGGLAVRIAIRAAD
jgi:signal transduction histidine kinase